MSDFTFILFMWFIQTIFCIFLNLIHPTRIPKSTWDFIKLTFFPYVLFWLVTKPEVLE